MFLQDALNFEVHLQDGIPPAAMEAKLDVTSPGGTPAFQAVPLLQPLIAGRAWRYRAQDPTGAEAIQLHNFITVVRDELHNGESPVPVCGQLLFANLRQGAARKRFEKLRVRVPKRCSTLNLRWTLFRAPTV